MKRQRNRSNWPPTPLTQQLIEIGLSVGAFAKLYKLGEETVEGLCRWDLGGRRPYPSTVRAVLEAVNEQRRARGKPELSLEHLVPQWCGVEPPVLSRQPLYAVVLIQFYGSNWLQDIIAAVLTIAGWRHGFELKVRTANGDPYRLVELVEEAARARQPMIIDVLPDGIAQSQIERIRRQQPELPVVAIGVDRPIAGVSCVSYALDGAGAPPARQEALQVGRRLAHLVRMRGGQPKKVYTVATLPNLGVVQRRLAEIDSELGAWAELVHFSTTTGRPAVDRFLTRSMRDAGGICPIVAVDHEASDLCRAVLGQQGWRNAHLYSVDQGPGWWPELGLSEHWFTVDFDEQLIALTAAAMIAKAMSEGSVPIGVVPVEPVTIGAGTAVIERISEPRGLRHISRPELERSLFADCWRSVRNAHPDLPLLSWSRD